MHILRIDSGSQYQGLIGVGGIGSGCFFALEGNHTMGRNESRPGRSLDVRDYCKLHIITHYVAKLLGAGRNQLAIAAQAAAMGGNVRVGLEDSLWGGPGRLAQSNAEQVRMVRQIVEGLGRSIATPDEARAILALKGSDQVGF